MAPRSRTAVAIAALALLALTGCQPDGPTVEPEPTSSVPPVFASDDEALAAAEEAYGAFLAILDDVSRDGGKDPQRIRAVATGDQAEREIASATEAAKLGERGSGKSKFDSLALQSFEPSSDTGIAIVTAYACLDLSDTDIIGADGNSILPEDSQTRFPVEIAFDRSGSTESGLVVSNVDIWTGDDFCDA